MKPINTDNSIEKSEKDLELIDKSPFSNDGFEEFKSSISTYIKILLRHSKDIAKMQNIENVSAVHVQRASQSLAKFDKNRWKDFNNTFSGILLGCAFSNLYNYAFAEAKITLSGIIFTALCGIVGAFLVGSNLKHS